jgi:glucose/arabinose dehydrogenase
MRSRLHIALALALALAALALAACSAPGPVAPPARPPAPSAAPTATAPATSPPASSSQPTSQPLPADLAHLRLGLVRVADGLDEPVDLENAHDGSNRLFVAEQPGRIRVIRDGNLLARPYLDITARVRSGGERGLLGIAFAPDFRANGHLYVNYTDNRGDTEIALFTANDPASDAPHWTGPSTVLHVSQPFPNHNGGCTRFGPDGYLWIGMGDGGSEGDPGNRTQNPRLLLGKMLRIDVEGPHPGKPYAIPPGQPVRAGWRPEIWWTGLRNPWRFSFDPPTGQVWIGDVGWNSWEEVDVVSADKPALNFGWPYWEGLHGSRANPKRDGFTFPVYEYPHPFGNTVTGGYVYRGSRYPALVGTYVYADFGQGWVGAMRTTAPDGTPLSSPVAKVMLRTSDQLPSFGIDEAGELYLLGYSGTVWRITASVAP